MVEIDGLWDELKHLTKPGHVPAETETLAPRALLLLEQFQELARRPDTVARPERFRNELQEATDASRGLHEALRRTDSGSPNMGATVAAAAATVAQSCTSCHALVRNRPRP
jgi:cytochrome c556